LVDCDDDIVALGTIVNHIALTGRCHSAEAVP
jgi:hypothetical protein